MVEIRPLGPQIGVEVSGIDVRTLDDAGFAAIYQAWLAHNVLVVTGQDLTIADFAKLVADVVGYTGEIVFDTSRPDGAPQKLLDVSRLAHLGWKARTELRTGIAAAYRDFLKGGGAR